MIYLDNAATTKPNETALKKAAVYVTEQYFNPSAPYKAGEDLNVALKIARSNLVRHIADENVFECIFTSCGTEGDNAAVFAYGRRGNVVTTEVEHSAVLNAVTELKNRGIAEPRIAKVLADGRVDIEHLLSLVDEKTTLVSVMHVNNETGAINDINAIAKAVKEKNPRVVFHSDGVQGYGKIPVKLSSFVDLYAVSAHKIGGLKGVGALFKKKSLAFRPLIYGGGQESGKRSGTENVFGIKSFEYAAEEKFKTLEADNKRLYAYQEKMTALLDGAYFKRISSKDGSPYILYVSAKILRGEIIVRLAYDRGLIISTASACSNNSKRRYSRVALACGLDEKTADGVLRISFSPETTEEEIVKASEILNAIAKEYAPKMR